MSTKRNIGKEILLCIKEIKAGKGKVTRLDIESNIINTRKRLGLTQLSFAKLIGVSVKTLQQWEQGLRKPRGSAVSLLRIANSHPEIFINLN